LNVTLFSPEEFRRKRALKDHFLDTCPGGKTINLKGTLDELEEPRMRISCAWKNADPEIPIL